MVLEVLKCAFVFLPRHDTAKKRLSHHHDETASVKQLKFSIMESINMGINPCFSGKIV